MLMVEDPENIESVWCKLYNPFDWFTILRLREKKCYSDASESKQNTFINGEQ